MTSLENTTTQETNELKVFKDGTDFEDGYYKIRTYNLINYTFNDTERGYINIKDLNINIKKENQSLLKNTTKIEINLTNITEYETDIRNSETEIEQIDETSIITPELSKKKQYLIEYIEGLQYVLDQSKEENITLKEDVKKSKDRIYEWKQRIKNYELAQIFKKMEELSHNRFLCRYELYRNKDKDKITELEQSVTASDNAYDVYLKQLTYKNRYQIFKLSTDMEKTRLIKQGIIPDRYDSELIDTDEYKKDMRDINNIKIKINKCIIDIHTQIETYSNMRQSGKANNTILLEASRTLMRNNRRITHLEREGNKETEIQELKITNETLTQTVKRLTPENEKYNELCRYEEQEKLLNDLDMLLTERYDCYNNLTKTPYDLKLGYMSSDLETKFDLKMTYIENYYPKLTIQINENTTELISPESRGAEERIKYLKYKYKYIKLKKNNINFK
jgi:hypothetical protein